MKTVRPRFALRLVWWAGLCAAMGAPLAAGQPPVPAALIDSILAVAEGRVIMRSDVRAFIDFGLVATPGDSDPTALVVTALIERELILDEVVRYRVDEPRASEVADRLRTVAERVGGAESLARTLAAVGYTMGDLEQVVRDDLRIERYLASRFPSAPPPTAEDVAAARQRLIDEWVASLMARAVVVRVGSF